MENNKQNNLSEILKKWQRIEDSSIRFSTDIISNCNNPIIQIIMEIIRHDSSMHFRVQQFLLEINDGRQITIDPLEIKKLMETLKEHENTEKEAIKFAESALNDIDSPIIRLFLEYLLIDEKKHDILVDNIFKLINE